ncbi:hypothetical protein PybrP1_003898 [[Pythium] brassicae (nom. inval.)]|nr:hypothetical protein PybrP1_003898 [[Pythium] brassicae (nom. inval.)]
MTFNSSASQSGKRGAGTLLLSPSDPRALAMSPRVTTSYVDLEALAKGSDGAPRLSSASSVHDAQHQKEHRERFLSDAERLIVHNPREARLSIASIEDHDPWHTASLDLVAKQLRADFDVGLTAADHAARVRKYGPNALAEDPRTPLYITFLLQFYNLIIAMLLFAALASLSLQEYVEGIAILFIVTLNATIATIQENSASNALEALSRLSSPQSTVLRDGAKVVVDSQSLVPGDIVLLATGDVVPADIRLVHSADLKVNEMLLTGESEDVSKKFNASMAAAGAANKLTADNMVFSSTTVTAGNARGVVVETGMGTRVGSIAALLQTKSGGADGRKGCRNPLSDCVAKYQPKLTPLQRSLHKLGFVMGAIALSVCAAVFLVGMIRGNKDPKHPDRPVWLVMVMLSVSLAVSAVPEGLPMVVTICLSSGTSAMEYDVSGKGFVPEGRITRDGVDYSSPGPASVHLQSALLASVLCSNTHLKQKEVDGAMSWVPFGNSSEAPLVVAAAKAGILEDAAAAEYPRVVEVPFSSSRKMMVTVNALPVSAHFGSLALDPTTKFVACVKGAPNYILANCTRFCRADGSLSELSGAQHQQIMDAVDHLSSQALRVLAVAIHPLAAIPYAPDCDEIEEKFAALARPLVLLGLVASIDPERDGVREAIATARHAGIRTVMITGDYLKTAVAIAQNIDLLQSGGVAAELEATDCAQLRPRGDEYLADHEIDEITSRTTVFARAKPEDKIAIVNIVAAVERGRVIYANIQKFVMFLLSTNVGEIILIFTTVAAGFPAPMEALQILILNLFSDGMPAVALSLEKGDPKIMEDRSRPKTQPLIHGRLWKLVGLNAVIIASGAIVVNCLGVYWNFGRLELTEILKQGGGAHGDDFLDVTCQRWDGVTSGWKTYGNCNARDASGSLVFPDLPNREQYEDATMYCEGGEYECLSEGIARSQTMTFICITYTEVLRAYTVRSFSQPMFVGMFDNGYLQFAASLSVILTIFVTNTPVIMTDIFGFAYIEWFQWLASICGALNAAFWGEMVKWFFRYYDRKAQQRLAGRTAADAQSIAVEDKVLM